MKFYRPKSLNSLILVGFGLVGLPLLIAVIWALVNLDRLAEQSEQLVFTGVTAAENNRLLVERVGSLERVVRQYHVLGSPDSLQLMQQDLASVEDRLAAMAPLTEEAEATALAGSIAVGAGHIVTALSQEGLDSAAAELAIAEFTPLRQRVSELTTVLSAHVDAKLKALQQRCTSLL